MFFAEFLAAAGVFDRWMAVCPLEHHSNNAPGKRDVLGILLLAIVTGHRRDAHVTALRGDARWNASTRQPAARDCARH